MRAFLLALALLPAPAAAAPRTYSVGSFDHVRVEGAFKVTIATGTSPSARVDGDRETVERVEIAPNGDTLVIRLGGGGWGERPGAERRAPITVALGTPRLSGITVIAGAEVEAQAMRGDRVDLATTGPGAIRVASATTDRLVATVIGNGAITVSGGRAAEARLWVNGPGAVAAPDLAADALVTRVEGSGTVEARARYTAQVTTTGLGAVTVHGHPKCQVRAAAGGPVTCGAE